MTPDHQCGVVETDSDSSWEDIESEQDEQLFPTLDPDSENWAEEFSNSIRKFHGSNHLI